MILFFLLLFDEHHFPGRGDEYIRETEIIHRKMNLTKGYSNSIISKSPGLAVVFINVYGTSIEVTSNNQIYNSDSDGSPYAGIDFGSTIGSITFTANEDTELEYTAVVFPHQCIHHHLISTYFFDQVYFSINSTDQDFKITSRQDFCYWNAIPTKKKYHIIVDSEKSFDRLIKYSKIGRTGDYSGKMDIHITSNSGMNYFQWSTDDSDDSNFFLINVSTLQFYKTPLLKKMFSGTIVNDVSPFYQSVPFPKQTPEPTQENSFIVHLLPPLAIVTFVLLITAIIFSIWALKLIAYFCLENDQEKETINFKSVKGDQLPQPTFATPEDSCEDFSDSIDENTQSL